MKQETYGRRHWAGKMPALPGEAGCRRAPAGDDVQNLIPIKAREKGTVNTRPLLGPSASLSALPGARSPAIGDRSAKQRWFPAENVVICARSGEIAQGEISSARLGGTPRYLFAAGNGKTMLNVAI